MEYEGADTDYEEDEASYDGADYKYQILNEDSEVVAIFLDKNMRDHVLKLLENHPVPE